MLKGTVKGSRALKWYCAHLVIHSSTHTLKYLLVLHELQQGGDCSPLLASSLLVIAYTQALMSRVLAQRTIP